MAVVGRVELVAHAVLHAGGAGCAALEAVGFVAGDLRLGAFVRAPRLAAEPVDRGGGVGLRDLQLTPLARFRARSTPASSPKAPNTGPALMPIDTCSGMYAKPSSSTFGCTIPAHASYAMPWLGMSRYGPVMP